LPFASHPSGTRWTAGAAWHILAAALAAGSVAAQAVPRADLPGARTLRLTFDPRIEYWDEELVDGTATRLGAALTGDSVRGGPALPDLARLETHIRTAGAAPGFVANLGAARLSALAQRRVTPITLEVGLVDRIAVGVTVPLVRTFVRASFALDTTGGNLGLNPLLTDGGAAGAYAAFFDGFAAAITNLETAITGGAYGCPGSAQCAAAQAFLAEARGVRDALAGAVYGTGTGGGAPFLPLAGTTGAAAVDANVARIQDEFRATYADSAFAGAFLFPAADAPLDAARFDQALADPSLGFGMRPFGDTPRRERFWLGDVELAGRVALVRGAPYAATVGLVWRLPTGHRASPGDPLALSAGDGQADIEAQLVQELTVGGRLWLNLSLRGGIQQAAARVRRVGPAAAFLLRPQAQATLRWDPGDYVAVDFAPLYRFHPWFAAGATFAYYAKGEDRYAFLAPQDSLDLATRLGTATAAALLDQGTAVRLARAGIAVTYVGPVLETGLTAQRTLTGGTGRGPAAWSFRLVLRVRQKLF
jgi:hypothetical protein